MGGLGTWAFGWGRIEATTLRGAGTLQQHTATCMSVCSCQVNIGMALDPESAAYRFTVEIPLPIDTVRTHGVFTRGSLTTSGLCGMLLTIMFAHFALSASVPDLSHCPGCTAVQHPCRSAGCRFERRHHAPHGP